MWSKLSLWCSDEQTRARAPLVTPAFVIAGMIAGWAAPHVFSIHGLRDIILLTTIAIGGLPILLDLLLQLKSRSFGIDILAFISTGSAILLKHYWVATIVILMFSGGRALEKYATQRASSVLRALSRRMPQVAHLDSGNGTLLDVPSEQIVPGDHLIVYPHELCPVDGTVVSGYGTMDESYLTGEPFDIDKAPGSVVLSGAVNGDSALTVRATRVASESRYARIVEVLHASEQNRPRMRRLGDRLGIWYAPLSIAIAVSAWALTGEVERFLAVVVIATPCPLLLALPVAITSAISVSARRGILIKHPSILENIGSCTTLIVDKTGTLTYGKPTLTEVVCTGPYLRRDLLQLAASLEKYSKHPLASALLNAAGEEQIPLLMPDLVREESGKGLIGVFGDRIVTLTGRGKLSEDLRHKLCDIGLGMECVVLVNGEIGGLLHFRDQPRMESEPFLRHVKSHHGFTRTVLLSGDRPAEVQDFAERMKITEVYGGKSPEEKLALVQKLTESGKTLYVGDGINDAPAMMSATAALALGVNSDVTSEAAGAVVLQSSLASIDELIHIGARMRRIAWTSAVGGMGLSAIGMAVAFAGFLTPVEGAILQEFIDLAAILNSLRMALPTAPLSDLSLAVAKPAPARTFPVLGSMPSPRHHG